MLVIMALVTTFMAGPALNLLDPKNSYGESLDTEMEVARATSRAELPALVVPGRAILVAPQTDEALVPLRTLSEPLARSEPPRELILARLVEPTTAADAGVRAGLQTEQRMLEESERLLREARLELADQGIASRGVAFVSAQPGHHLVQLAESEEVDLVMLDGSRPLLGGGIPRGDVGYVLEHAPTDVAVLVAREGAEITELGKPVVVPFGGQEHDWAALELGAWMASATGAELRLLGAAGQTEDTTKVRRVLDDASLLVRQFAAVEPEPVIPDAGGLLEAVDGAGLLVVGLSQRWRREGLGSVRSELAKAGVAPILFVRRGERQGALAPRSDVTHFAWSSAGMGGGFSPAGPS
jgi:hypothetical protein